MSAGWLSGYEKKPRLKLATTGRRTGRRHEVSIYFVVHNGGIFVTSASNKRDWMKNALKNPNVEVTIDGVTNRMKAEVTNSEEMRKTIERLYRAKCPFSSRFLRLAHRGKYIFELRRLEGDQISKKPFR